MSVFEIIMLVCFGAAWPFSIYKSYKSREIGGKSVVFLFVVFVGYIGGILHKLFYSYDPVVFLYGLNGTMVLIDIALYFRNRLYHIRQSLREDTPREDALEQDTLRAATKPGTPPEEIRKDLK